MDIDIASLVKAIPEDWNLKNTAKRKFENRIASRAGAVLDLPLPEGARWWYEHSLAKIADSILEHMRLEGTAVRVKPTWIPECDMTIGDMVEYLRVVEWRRGAPEADAELDGLASAIVRMVPDILASGGAIEGRAERIILFSSGGRAEVYPVPNRNIVKRPEFTGATFDGQSLLPGIPMFQIVRSCDTLSPENALEVLATFRETAQSSLDIVREHGNSDHMFTGPTPRGTLADEQQIVLDALDRHLEFFLREDIPAGQRAEVMEAVVGVLDSLMARAEFRMYMRDCYDEDGSPLDCDGNPVGIPEGMRM